MIAANTMVFRHSDATLIKPRHIKPSPCTFLLWGTSNLTFREPIYVLAEYSEGGNWLATNAEIRTHGFGDNCEESVNDFGDMLDDYYNELINSESVLAPHLKTQLDYLRSIIVDA